MADEKDYWFFLTLFYMQFHIMEITGILWLGTQSKIFIVWISIIWYLCTNLFLNKALRLNKSVQSLVSYKLRNISLELSKSYDLSYLEQKALFSHFTMVGVWKTKCYIVSSENHYVVACLLLSISVLFWFPCKWNWYKNIIGKKCKRSHMLPDDIWKILKIFLVMIT